jgi:hypothetical protein
VNSKFPLATLPIIFNTLLASSLLGRAVVGIASRLDEMEGTSLMSLAVIASSPTSMSLSLDDSFVDSTRDVVGANWGARFVGGSNPWRRWINGYGQ